MRQSLYMHPLESPLQINLPLMSSAVSGNGINNAFMHKLSIKINHSMVVDFETGSIVVLYYMTQSI